MHALRGFLPILLAAVALAVLGFMAAFVMVFLGDPEFPRPMEVTPQAIAEFTARMEQPYPAETRRFTMRDKTVLTAQSFPATSDTTILLVHGILSASFLLNRSSGLLREATGAEVVAIDLRGHGSSGGFPGDIDYIGQYEDDLADVVAALRSAKPNGKVILAGHSMGGGIALRYASRPGVPPVDGTLLLAPHMGPKSPTTPMERTEAGDRMLRVHVLRTIGLAVFNSVGITTFNGLHTLFFNLPKEFPLRSYSYRAMVGGSPQDHAPALRAIHHPLLLVAGSKDEAFRSAEYEAAVRPHSRGEVVIVDGATHDGVLHDPRALAAIGRWMRARSPRLAQR